MDNERLKEECVEEVVNGGIIADRTVRARQKTVVFGIQFNKVCRDIFKDEASESDWLSAIEQFGEKKRLPLPAPEPEKLEPSNCDVGETPAQLPPVIEVRFGPVASETLVQKEERIFHNKAVPVPAPRKQEQLESAPQSTLVGFLVSFEAERTGETIELREGRWIISSNCAGETRSTIVIKDASVSECHATLRAKAGSIEIADQMSDLGTGVIRKGSVTEEKIEERVTKLHHGDELRLGGRRYSVCLIEMPARNFSTGSGLLPVC